MDAIRNGIDEYFEERSGVSHVCPFEELDHSELRSPVDSDEQVELVFGSFHLG